MAKWEYCVIKGADSGGTEFLPLYPKIIFFSIHGIETEIELGNKSASNRPKEWQKVSEAGYVAHMIAKLGVEGWEMVNAVAGSSTSGTGPTSIYFRRLVSDS